MYIQIFMSLLPKGLRIYTLYSLVKCTFKENKTRLNMIYVDRL